MRKPFPMSQAIYEGLQESHEAHIDSETAKAVESATEFLAGVIAANERAVVKSSITSTPGVVTISAEITETYWEYDGTLVNQEGYEWEWKYGVGVPKWFWDYPYEYYFERTKAWGDEQWYGME